MNQYYRLKFVLGYLVLVFVMTGCGTHDETKESQITVIQEVVNIDPVEERDIVSVSENGIKRVSEIVQAGEASIFAEIDIKENKEENTEESKEENIEENEYTNFAIADVKKYVNVRTEPSTEGDIVGKMYDGAVAEILSTAGQDDEWFQIKSGNVEGYIKAEYFIYGNDAAAVMDEYVTRYAEVWVDRLNVRPEPSTEEARIGYIDKEEKVKVLEDCGEWLRIQYTEEKEGYISEEYVIILEEYTYAKTLEEEQAEIDERKSREERKKTSNEEKPEAITNIVFPSTTYTSNEELRKAIVNHAMQYLGNRYVSGGSSLAGGTDCSGFTCFIYADFGYSISRTPGGQLSGAGRSIDYTNIQPGDIICYSSNGRSCTHVGLYIGNGQIIHSANPRKGVVIGAAGYDTIVGIKNVID